LFYSFQLTFDEVCDLALSSFVSQFRQSVSTLVFVRVGMTTCPTSSPPPDPIPYSVCRRILYSPFRIQRLSTRRIRESEKGRDGAGTGSQWGKGKQRHTADSHSLSTALVEGKDDEGGRTADLDTLPLFSSLLGKLIVNHGS